jgi:hypothetical protein
MIGRHATGIRIEIAVLGENIRRDVEGRKDGLPHNDRPKKQETNKRLDGQKTGPVKALHPRGGR